VYFVGNGASIKIGYSEQPGRRFNSLKVGSYKSLTFLGCVVGTRNDEKSLHRDLKNFRLEGEWFVDCAPVRERIEAVMVSGFEPSLPSTAKIHDDDAGRDPEFLRYLRETQRKIAGRYPPGTLEGIIAHREAIARGDVGAVASAEEFIREFYAA